MGTTVLVTGAAGFIGSHLARRLTTEGHAVRALDVRAPLTGALSDGSEHHQADIRDRDRLAALLDGVDTVYHLASVHLEVHETEEAFEDVNVGAVEELVRASADAGVRRLVHTSSVGIFGHVEDPPAREDSPKRPRTAYERTKLAGESVALARAAECGLEAIALRPAWVYGPGCPRTEKLIRSLRKRRFLYIGSGRNLRHPLFIDDMLDAFMLAAASSSGLGRAYIIAGPRAMPLDEVVKSFADALGVPAPKARIPRFAGMALASGAEMVSRALGREPALSRRSLAFFENDNAFDTSAARRDLGFEPKVDLAEGLRLTLAEAGLEPALASS